MLEPRILSLGILTYDAKINVAMASFVTGNVLNKHNVGIDV